MTGVASTCAGVQVEITCASVAMSAGKVERNCQVGEACPSKDL